MQLYARIMEYQTCQLPNLSFVQTKSITKNLTCYKFAYRKEERMLFSDTLLTTVSR